MHFRSIFRAVAAAFAGLLMLMALASAALWHRSARMLTAIHDVPPHAQLALPTDSASLARGEHVARTMGSCTLCHGADFGGAVYGAADSPFGIVAGPNLTRGRGGVGGELSVDDWVRAIRYGVRRDGTSLIIMPSEVFGHLSDEDLAALIAYLRSLPAVDREPPRTHFRPLGRALLALGKLPLLVAPKTAPLISVPSVEPGPTIEYGRYLVETSGCAGCHGYGLSGGRVAGPPTEPPASNLTPAGAIGQWTEEDFLRAMRQGIRPDGSPIDDFMPWMNLGQMTDEELHAIWLFLRSVPAKQFGHK